MNTQEANEPATLTQKCVRVFRAETEDSSACVHCVQITFDPFVDAIKVHCGCFFLVGETDLRKADIVKLVGLCELDHMRQTVESKVLEVVSAAAGEINAKIKGLGLNT